MGRWRGEAWNRIVDSRLWYESDVVLKVYLTLLAKRDEDNVVRGTSWEIGAWAKKTEIEVLGALKVLSEVDAKAGVGAVREGRRIERVEGGWRVLGGDDYKVMAGDDERRRERRAKEARARRQKKREAGLTLVEVFRREAEFENDDGMRRGAGGGSG